jgi:hypothetical protein
MSRLWLIAALLVPVAAARGPLYSRQPDSEWIMPHQLPEFGYIVGFIACIIGVFIVSNVLAALNGYREK